MHFKPSMISTLLVSSESAALRGVLLIVMAALFWGTTGVTARYLFTETDLQPLTLALLRLWIAFPCFYLLMRREWRRLPSDQKPHLSRSILLALLALGVFQGAYQGTYMLAVDLTSAGIATLIALCVSPVLVLLLAAPLLGEKPGWITVLALLGALSGTLLLVAGDLEVSGQLRLAGILVALLAALIYAGFTLTSRFAAGGAPVFTTAFICFLTGALVLLPVVWLQDGFAGLGQLGLTGWLLVVYIGLVPTCLGYLCFFTGMKTTSATTSSIIMTLEPMFVALLAWLWLGEWLGTLGLIGTAVLVVSVLLATRQKAG